MTQILFSFLNKKIHYKGDKWNEVRTMLLLIIIAAFFTACSISDSKNSETNNRFSEELALLNESFHLPGIAILVSKGNEIVYEDYMGFADISNQTQVDSSTTFPMASLTKIFTGILIMQLVEDQKIALDEPINKYAKDLNIPDSIKIKHVLSHTSQGNVGQNFYYSSRFGLLTSVIEKASGQSFEEAMTDKIIRPLGLRNTYLLKDSLQLLQENRKIAKPYYFDGETKEGAFTFGYSASNGITSTVRDLAKLSNALDANTLISEHSKQTMFAPFKDDVPYGMGIFSQKFQNMDLVWGYGQYNCYSSLFLKVPDKELTLIIVANNNLISDPARLIYGDISYSMFAISFLKNYVLDLVDELLFEDSQSLKTLESRITSDKSEFYLKKLLAQSISASFMAKHDHAKIELSIAILEKVFKLYPDYETYAELTLMHHLTLLRAASKSIDQQGSSKFDNELEKVGKKLLSTDPDNPYANFYLANYYSSKDATDLALKHFEKIIYAKNFSRNWYTIEAEEWINDTK